MPNPSNNSSQASGQPEIRVTTLADQQWREAQNGWAVSFGDGMSANIQVTRKNGVRWNFAITGQCETVADARERVEFFYRVLTEEESLA